MLRVVETGGVQDTAAPFPRLILLGPLIQELKIPKLMTPGRLAPALPVHWFSARLSSPDWGRRTACRAKNSAAPRMITLI